MTGDRKPSAEDMDAAIAALSQHGDPLRPYQVEAVAKAIAERVNREVERRREAQTALRAALEFFELQLDADIEAHIPANLHQAPLKTRRAEMRRREGNLDAIADLEENIARIRAVLVDPPNTSGER